jgi:hypothetical protein
MSHTITPVLGEVTVQELSEGMRGHVLSYRDVSGCDRMVIGLRDGVRHAIHRVKELTP